MTQEEKMSMWYRGQRGFNISASSTTKILENYKICCDHGYFLQVVRLRKELYNRGILNEMPEVKLLNVPSDYYTTHNQEEITADLLEYLNLYVSKDGYSILKNNLFLGKDEDSGVLYYGWDQIIDADLRIDIEKGIAKFTGYPEIDYTKDINKVIELAKEELFYG